jgi:hypothetical protein
MHLEMIELNLKNIILEADFSPIYMGQNEREVVQILGEPVNRYDNGIGSVLFSYSGYELHFFDDILHYFQNDNLKQVDGVLFQNKYFKMNTWFLKPNVEFSMKEVISILEKERVQFKIENQKVAGKDYRVDEIKFIELANGISLNFENTGLKEGKEVRFKKITDFVLFAIRYDDFNQKK